MAEIARVALFRPDSLWAQELKQLNFRAIGDYHAGVRMRSHTAESVSISSLGLKDKRPAHERPLRATTGRSLNSPPRRLF